MKNATIVRVFAGLAALGMVLSGCKSAPELTASAAQTLIQANYDQSPAVGASIRVNDPGMLAGANEKYWSRTKVYPNKYWADFTLSADGKKVVTLPAGGDVIQWRPDSADDKSYAVTVTTVATNHLKAHDVKDPQDEADGTKICVFNEAVSLDGVPGPLQDMAHKPGNRLAVRRTATFTLDGNAWKLSSVN